MFVYSVDWSVFMLRQSFHVLRIYKDSCCVRNLRVARKQTRSSILQTSDTLVTCTPLQLTLFTRYTSCYMQNACVWFVFMCLEPRLNPALYAPHGNIAIDEPLMFITAVYQSETLKNWPGRKGMKLIIDKTGMIYVGLPQPQLLLVSAIPTFSL